MRTMAFFGCCCLLVACGKSVIGDGGEGGTGAGNGGGAAPIPTGPITGGGSGSTGSLVRVISATEKTAVEEQACNGWAFEPEGAPSKIEFVIDISSSMSQAATGNGGATKWEATRDALIEAIVGGTGSGLSAATAVGLLFYPGTVLANPPTTPQDPTSCLNLSGSVPMAQLGDAMGAQRQTVQTALSTIPLGKGTPTHDAYKYALDNVVLSSAQKAIAGDPYMLLITDGMPTLQYGCYNTSGDFDYTVVPTQPIIDEVTRAASLGVKTFVIGSPGSEEGRTWLSDAAIAGGTAPAGCSSTGPTYCHMDMTTAPDFSAALSAGLSQVVAAVTSCKFDIPTQSTDGKQTVDPNQVYPFITYSSGSIELIGRDYGTATCTGEGYRLLSSTQLELCAAPCDRYKADPKALLEFMFGCNGIDEILQ